MCGAVEEGVVEEVGREEEEGRGKEEDEEEEQEEEEEHVTLCILFVVIATCILARVAVLTRATMLRLGVAVCACVRA